MPIGKNAIKRVENNGYSKVETKAPDMQNSHVISAPTKEVLEKIVSPIEKKNAPTKKKTKSVLTKKDGKTTKDGFITFSFGEDLPYYLL